MYLKNSICKFNPLFDIDYSNKKNIISASFFKIQGGGYTSFDKYLNGIFLLNQFVIKEFPDFELRLFIDQTISDDKVIFEKLKKNKIKLISFECSSFLTSSFHRGIFGMIVRFFPMFNFENNDAKNIIISDIDFSNSIKEYFFTLRDKINFFEKNNIKDLHSYFYGTLRDISIIRGNKIIPFIISPLQINYKRIDSNVLIQYINNYKQYKTKILKTYEHATNKIKKSNDEYIFYGWDEYFINNNYIDHLISDKISFSITYSYFITINLYYINKKTHTFKSSEITILENFYRSILKNSKKFTFKNINESFNYVDNLFFNTDYANLNNEQLNICFKIYEFYISNYHNNLDLFGKDFVNVILSDYYIGKIEFNEDKYYNSESKIIDIYFSKLPDDLISKLKDLKIKYNIPKVLI